MTLLVLSVVGSDRPGLTRAVAGAVGEAGGNWLESHLSRLGGLYVGSVLVDLSDGSIEALRAALAKVDAAGLEVRIVPAQDRAGGAPEVIGGDTLAFTLVGQDRPGIVKQVTATISELGANIETFKTWLSDEAHSGGHLFHMDANLRLQPGLAAATVQDALEAISGEIMVDVAVKAKG